jgi:hypothetical protein
VKNILIDVEYLFISWWEDLLKGHDCAMVNALIQAQCTSGEHF